MIQGAIFDFDGTLYDSMDIWEVIGPDYMHAHGLEPRPDFRDRQKVMSLYQTAVYLQQDYGLNLTVQEIMDGINKTAEHYYFYSVLPKPGVPEFLEEMRSRGVRMCIATASDYVHIDTALKRCHLSEYFDEILTCADVGHGKDEPILFREALKHLGTEKERTPVFEDALHAVQTAKRDGFRVIGIADRFEDNPDQIQALADCYVEDYRKLDSFWKLAREL